MKPWINRNVLLISLSAFFADTGYQAVLAALPIVLVIGLGAPAYYLGLAYALMYGIGAIFGYAGGKLGDRFGQWRIAMLGNSVIPILSFVGLAGNPLAAIAIVSFGWWARDFRSPPRRGLLRISVRRPLIGRAFGFLHALDISGGVVATTYVLVLLGIGFALKDILLIAILPLIVSTVVLSFVSVGRKALKVKSAKKKNSEEERINRSVLFGVLIGTSLFGFSFFSAGFPILTITQISGSGFYGILSYMLYLGVSAPAGLVLGSRIKNKYSVKALALAGYALAGIASLTIGASYLLHIDILVAYLGVGLLGLALGAIETFEPTIISLVSRRGESTAFGYLTSARSIGLFSSNLVMGVFYFFSIFDSYVYAASVSFAAALILVVASRGFKG